VAHVDYIFHAAALKQVSSCEFFPIRLSIPIVFGTENVIDSAIEHGVKNVVVLSTDKAAYPFNALGISKRLVISRPGRADRYLPAPPQIRTSGFPASGSSSYGFAA